MQSRQPGRRRHSWSVAASLALHAAVVGLVSLKACREQPRADLRDPPVTVEVTAFASPPAPKTPVPGGGAPAQPPARRVTHRRAEPAAPQVAVAVAEEPHGREVPTATAVDAIAAPSRAASAPAPAGPSGSGPGAHGGPGGPGAGPGGDGPPLVSANFAFGGATPGRFKGVACFIPVGVLRIADVRTCAVVAMFYANTFNVSERHEPEGFPGISERATWFLIEYTGAFTVGKDGTYEFRLHSDDGSYLFIDGQMVIENDGKHQPESRRGSVQLGAGEHQLRLLYAQTTDRMALQLYVRAPGAREVLFTPKI